MSVINIAESARKNDEIRTPAKVVYVEKSCPKCGFGRMEFTGRAAQPDSSKPPIFEHICSKCRHQVAYGKQYPRAEFEKVEAEVKDEAKD
jgi:ribosomal protein L37AE/L43A